MLLPALACSERGETRSPAAAASDVSDTDVITAGPPIVTIGGNDATALFEVTGAVRLSDGSVVIANNGTADLRWFDDRGDLVRTVGGKGGGPGEFRSIYSVAVAADTVFAFDLRLSRVSRFSRDGALLGSTTLKPPPGTTSPMFIGPGDGGSLIAQVTRAATRISDGQLHRDSVLLLRFARDGRVLDTLGAYRGAESVSRTHSVAGRTLTLQSSYDFYQGFAAAAGMAQNAAGTSGIVAGTSGIVAAGATDSATIDLYTDGRKDRLAWDAPVVPFDESHIDALMERERRESSNPEALRQAREVYDALPRPATLPVFRTIIVGADGRVWVRAMVLGGPGAPESWWIFSGAASRPARIDLQPGQQLLSAGGDHVLVLARDALDVEQVMVLPLSGAGAGPATP